MKVIQTELKGYNRRTDNSVSLRLDSLLELTSQDIAEIDSHRGDITVVVITDEIIGNEVKIDVDEILSNLPENDIYDNYKSPSKRFRDILWRLLEQELGHKPSKEEFADYYKREYEKICSHYKEKFEDSDII